MSSEITIHTSYFGNAKKLKDNAVLRVAICVGLPRFGGYDMTMQVLAPTRDMIKKEVSQAEYDTKFDTILSELDPRSIVDELQMMAHKAGVADVAIMCYEKPGDFCHRHVVAKWLNDNKIETGLDYDVNEWGQAARRERTLFEKLDDI